jgi:hypothetical protein
MSCTDTDVTTGIFIGAMLGAVLVSGLRLAIEMFCDWRARK